MKQLSFSIEETITLTGLGKTKLYELIKSGELKAKKLGKRTLILKPDLKDFLSRLKNYPSQSEEI